MSPMTVFKKYLVVLSFPSGALAQHVPDLSPYAIGLMADVLIDELLIACRDQKRPDWLTREECERLNKERERRLRNRKQRAADAEGAVRFDFWVNSSRISKQGACLAAAKGVLLHR